MKERTIAFLIFAAILIFALAASWGFACLLMWIASLCFNIGFSFNIATGIWLVLLLVGGAFRSTSSSGK